MQTITEKILSSHAGKKVYAGELAVVWVDGIMASNATVRHAVKAFEEMGGVKLWDVQECTFVIDHASLHLMKELLISINLCETLPLIKALDYLTLVKEYAIS